MIDGTSDDLAHVAQSGKLVASCHCKPGFTGIACENIDQECILPERKCSNGSPCRPKENDDGSTKWACDCALADSLSEFAGQMCRNPLTEYCSGKFDPHSPLVFCTNGGRCRADIIGAQVDPGNTTVNSLYQHAGCVCPRDFYGPHCEFLRLNIVDDLDESFDFKEVEKGIDGATRPSAERKNKYSFALAILFACMSAALVAIAIKLHFRRRPVGPPVDEVDVNKSQENVSVMSMGTANHGSHWLENVDFLDEGIIVENEGVGRLETVYESPELM